MRAKQEQSKQHIKHEQELLEQFIELFGIVEEDPDMISKEDIEMSEEVDICLHLK